MASDEVVDVVDDDDHVISSATRAEVDQGGLRCRLAAVVCRNSKGQVFVHRRSATRAIFPNLYDMMVAEHVKAGESYSKAATRGLLEELAVDGASLRELFKLRYDDPRWPSWVTVFETVWDGQIRANPDEIVGGAFVDEDELVEKLDDWPFTPDGVIAYREYLARRDSSHSG